MINHLNTEKRNALREYSKGKERQNFVINFYEKYLGELIIYSEGLDNDIYTADSPFGNGKIFISSQGGWYDEFSNLVGNMEDFLVKKYPLMTQSGCLHAVKAEYFDLREFLPEKKGQLNHHIECNMVKILAGVHKGGDHKYINGFKADTIDFYENGDVHYAESHKLNYPGNLKFEGTKGRSYRIDSSYANTFLSFIHGVQKVVEHPDKNCIYFVENPLQLALLSYLIDDPVYIRPNGESYFHNDYKRLVEGKKVMIAKKTEPGPLNIDNLDWLKFDSNEEVDFFSFYGEEVPFKKAIDRDISHLEVMFELTSQLIIMNDYIHKNGF